MTGLAESRQLYEQYGRPAIFEAFPEFEGRIAAGLAGHGSECFGFDDDLSRDHDFDTGFCLWLTDEDDILIGPRLARLYRNLPHGEKTSRSAMGEKKLGVIRISDFYRRYTGSEGAPTCWQQWMSLPSYALAEATNGEVFRDDLGQFSAEREAILHGMPEDVRKKKIAARAVEMAQSGQYNYSRCLSHGEPGAAMLAAAEFVRSANEMIFLLNRKHAPYYKWVFRAMNGLNILPECREELELILSGDSPETRIEKVSAAVIGELRRQDLSDNPSDYLETHAFEVMERIENREIRSLHVMEG